MRVWYMYPRPVSFVYNCNDIVVRGLLISSLSPVSCLLVRNDTQVLDTMMVLPTYFETIMPYSIPDYKNSIMNYIHRPDVFILHVFPYFAPNCLEPDIRCQAIAQQQMHRI